MEARSFGEAAVNSAARPHIHEVAIGLPALESQASRQQPVCIDLEGALLWVNLSLESALGGIKRAPWILMLLPIWWLRGKAFLQGRLARLAAIDARTLPYRAEALNFIEAARAAGRPVWLVTSNNQRYATAVAEHLGSFDRIVTSDDSGDLAKARQVQTLLGGKPFEYFGGKALPRPGMASSMRAWTKGLRLHQWAKNALLFAPVVTAHAITDLRILTAAFLAFVSMGMCASATYVLNDLLDLESDRQHARKRFRPFASGALSASSGLLIAALLLIGGGLAASVLPPLFKLALGAYIAITLLYSFWFKRIASLDVVTLAGLYTLRVVAGAWATGIRLSFWLLAFSLFLFLCLALAKRVAELVNHRRMVETREKSGSALKGREYGLEDTPMLQIMGATSGYMSVLILALYINSPDVSRLYAAPELLWLIAPAMLLWITRLWIVTSRGYMDEDPISFAIRDPETWATAAFTVVMLVLATRM